MLVIGIITPNFYFSGFQTVGEQQKCGVFRHNGYFLLPPFQQVQNITELNVLLQCKWGGEIIEIRSATTSLGYYAGFVLLVNDCKYPEQNWQM